MSDSDKLTLEGEIIEPNADYPSETAVWRAYPWWETPLIRAKNGVRYNVALEGVTTNVYRPSDDLLEDCLTDHDSKLADLETRLSALRREFNAFMTGAPDQDGTINKISELLEYIDLHEPLLQIINQHLRTLDDEVASLKRRVTTNEQDIATLKGNIVHVNQRIDTTNQNVTNNKNRLDAHDIRFVNHETELALLDGKIEAVNRWVAEVEGTANSSNSSSVEAAQKAAAAEILAQAANTLANTAVSTASQAGVTANSAMSTAQLADTKAQTANENAAIALQQVDEALEKAEDAISRATNVVDDARNALEAANTATNTATDAYNLATNVSSQFAGVSETANNAMAKANKVESDLNTLSGTVQDVSGIAQDAKSLATTANNNANSAKTTATAAQTTANTASTNANTALKTANRAIEALAFKANDTDVVHKAGDEVITGKKYFNDQCLNAFGINLGKTQNNTGYAGYIDFYKNAGTSASTRLIENTAGTLTFNCNLAQSGTKTITAATFAGNATTATSISKNCLVGNNSGTHITPNAWRKVASYQSPGNADDINLVGIINDWYRCPSTTGMFRILITSSAFNANNTEWYWVVASDNLKTANFAICKKDFLFELWANVNEKAWCGYRFTFFTESKGDSTLCNDWVFYNNNNNTTATLPSGYTIIYSKSPTMLGKAQNAGTSDNTTSMPNMSDYATVAQMNTALAAKANDADVVHKTGNESITGIKHFAHRCLQAYGIELGFSALNKPGVEGHVDFNFSSNPNTNYTARISEQTRGVIRIAGALEQNGTRTAKFSKFIGALEGNATTATSISKRAIVGNSGSTNENSWRKIAAYTAPYNDTDNVNLVFELHSWYTMPIRNGISQIKIRSNSTTSWSQANCEWLWLTATNNIDPNQFALCFNAGLVEIWINCKLNWEGYILTVFSETYENRTFVDKWILYNNENSTSTTLPSGYTVIYSKAPNMLGKAQSAASSDSTAQLPNMSNYVTQSQMTTELGKKANDADVVHKTGNESITGIKYFANRCLQASGIELGYSALNTEGGTGYIDFHRNTNVDYSLRLIENTAGTLTVYGNIAQSGTRTATFSTFVGNLNGNASTATTATSATTAASATYISKRCEVGNHTGTNLGANAWKKMASGTGITSSEQDVIIFGFMHNWYRVPSYMGIFQIVIRGGSTIKSNETGFTWLSATSKIEENDFAICYSGTNFEIWVNTPNVTWNSYNVVILSELQGNFSVANTVTLYNNFNGTSSSTLPAGYTVIYSKYAETSTRLRLPVVGCNWNQMEVYAPIHFKGAGGTNWYPIFSIEGSNSFWGMGIFQNVFRIKNLLKVNNNTGSNTATGVDIYANGTITSATQSKGNNSTNVATTAFVQQALADYNKNYTCMIGNWSGTVMTSTTGWRKVAAISFTNTSVYRCKIYATIRKIYSTDYDIYGIVRFRFDPNNNSVGSVTVDLLQGSQFNNLSCLAMCHKLDGNTKTYEIWYNVSTQTYCTWSWEFDVATRDEQTNKYDLFANNGLTLYNTINSTSTSLPAGYTVVYANANIPLSNPAPKLGTATVGASNNPIYLNAGTPTATGGTLAKNITGSVNQTINAATSATGDYWINFYEMTNQGNSNYRVATFRGGFNGNNYLFQGAHDFANASPNTLWVSRNASTTSVTFPLGTIGSTSKPIYMNNGQLAAISATVGGTSKPVYLNAGTVTAISATVGATNKPVYLNAGTVTAISATVGATNKPVYLNAGTVTAISGNIGSASQPIYSNNGTLTAGNSIPSTSSFVTSSSLNSTLGSYVTSTHFTNTLKDYVTISTNQTITGQKTFANFASFNNGIQSTRLELMPGSTSAGNGGYIDFHWNKSSADYTSRLIESSSGTLHVVTNLKVAGILSYNVPISHMHEYFSDDVDKNKQVSSVKFANGLTLQWGTAHLIESDHVVITLAEYYNSADAYNIVANPQVKDESTIFEVVKESANSFIVYTNSPYEFNWITLGYSWPEE